MAHMQMFTDALKPSNVSSLEWPGKLTFHTATCLVNPDEVGNTIWCGGPRLTQKVLILWGKDDEEHITSDIWVLEIDVDDIENFKWKKVKYSIRWINTIDETTKCTVDNPQKL